MHCKVELIWNLYRLGQLVTNLLTIILANSLHSKNKLRKQEGEKEEEREMIVVIVSAQTRHNYFGKSE